MKTRQNKMMGYLAVTAGVGCASSVANAGVVFYGNSSNTNIQADPIGISFGSDSFVDDGGTEFTFSSVYSGSNRLKGYGMGYFFTSGLDIPSGFSDSRAVYSQNSFLQSGSVSGDQNYANISFDGDDEVYEAVAQFYLDGAGGGYLMAIATVNAVPNPQDLTLVGGPDLSISAGKAMIDAAAAIPEPSSLALLALGATGLIARRRRAMAA